MSTVRRMSGVVLCAALFVFLSSCPRGPDRDKVVPVSGTVTFLNAQGEKVSLTGGRVAAIRFTTGDGRPPAHVTIQENGHYELSTYDTGDGAVVGLHQVAIELRGPQIPLFTEPPPPGEPMPITSPEDFFTPGEMLSPQKYADPATSGLTKEVTEKGPNVFDFEIPNVQEPSEDE